MSIQAVGWALDNSKSRGFARLVLIALCNHAGAEDDECWPAQRTIAREAGVSPGSIPPQIRKLVELGEIEVVSAGGPRQSARYRIVRTQRPAGEHGERPRGERSARPRAERERAAKAEQNHQEPSGNHHSADEPPRSRKRTPRDDLFDALVRAFGPASTPSRAAFYGKTVNELLAAGATPAQIQAARVEMSRRGWDKPSPEAMLKHWDALLAEQGPTNPAATRWWEDQE